MLVGRWNCPLWWNGRPRGHVVISFKAGIFVYRYIPLVELVGGESATRLLRAEGGGVKSIMKVVGGT